MCSVKSSYSKDVDVPEFLRGSKVSAFLTSHEIVWTSLATACDLYLFQKMEWIGLALGQSVPRNFGVTKKTYAFIELPKDETIKVDTLTILRDVIVEVVRKWKPDVKVFVEAKLKTVAESLRTAGIECEDPPSAMQAKARRNARGKISYANSKKKKSAK
eukprot:GHVU01144510.1.p2 GENE.GHVU01144510.1~~GHVU01144510.1.p2  ORF type:complete len:159 (+),score=19.40 GHVU01144510.1:1651-2127(+)